MAEIPGLDPMLLQLALLAGVGLTQLPKLQQGMGSGKKAAEGESAGGPPGMAQLAPLLQMLAAKQQGSDGAGVLPPDPAAALPSNQPAVPRFPAPPPMVSAQASTPAIPRLGPMDAS